MKKYTIQIVIKDHAREIDVKSEFVESLKLGDKVLLPNIFNYAIIENGQDLKSYEVKLKEFNEIKEEMTEAYFVVYKVQEFEDSNWLQVIVVEPEHTIKKIFEERKQEALQDPVAFFKNLEN